MSDRATNLAARVRDDVLFLGSALSDYARSEQLDRAGLAAAPGVEVAALPALELCRRPRPDSFRQDVERIADAFGARVETVAEAVRRSDALEVFRAAKGDSGALMAARDRDGDGKGPS